MRIRMLRNAPLTRRYAPPSPQEEGQGEGNKMKKMKSKSRKA